ncbi:PilZ domain-containing protein [Sphingomonas sp. GCM10030256]|uniref:PilZ domain-containing protein n=1 Tax=Sphingomonas sp. GCM10030256 TaxID=3273427 RepID=UPI0036109672
MIIRGRIAEDTGEADRRRSPRHQVELDGRLRELGTTGTEARILNLSETGFMAETDEDFEVGARVWLMLPGRDRANAVIRWTAAGKIGAEFAEPIDPAHLAG